MVGARTLFIMGDLVLHLQGHDLDLQGHITLLVQYLEQFKLDSPYSHQICIMVGARTLFILGDLVPHLQGHDLDLLGHISGTIQARFTIFAPDMQARFTTITSDMHHGSGKNPIYYGTDPAFSWHRPSIQLALTQHSASTDPAFSWH